MADNLLTQSTAPATPPAGTPIATREVTYSGDTLRHIAPVGLVKFSGADDAKTATDVNPASEDKQDAGNTSLASIDSKTPASPATSGKQDTGNTSIASIDTKTPALGQALAAASVPIVLTAAQLTTLTPPAAIAGFATSAKQDTGNTSLSSIDGKITAVNTGAVVVSSSALPSGAAASAKQDTGNTSVASIDTKTPALGQALAAASVPVVLTAAQITTLTPPAAITGYSTEATLATRLSESDFDTKTGSLTETAPATDTASSGLNGRLQRIAQRLTSLITALGSPFQAGGSIGNTTFAATAVANGFADGAQATIGLKADAKNSATDTTSITAMSVWKQISASVQSLVTGTVLAAGTALVGLVGRKLTFGAKTTITWTGTSLANGSGRESTVIDNTTNRFADVRIRIQTKGQASGTAYVDWYVYTALGDTTYTDAATGSDAAFTAAGRRNSRYLGSTLLNANTSAVQGEFMLSDIFASMPDKWGLIGINNSGASLSATAGDHVLEYEGVN